ncbi:MAG: DEAD/DEAH box helicase [Planctomycetaceae bacterium]|nr:DEAD/DEAH box helicase [Planctomycetaceae bacterium]
MARNQKKSGGQGKNQNRDRNRRQNGAQSPAQDQEAQRSQGVWDDNQFDSVLPSYGSFLMQYENDWDDDWDDDDTPIEKKVAAQKAEKAKAKKKKQAAAQPVVRDKSSAAPDKKQPEIKSQNKKSQDRTKPPVHEDERLFNNEDDRGLTLKEIDVTCSESRSDKRKPGDKKQLPQKQGVQKQESKDKAVSKPAPAAREAVTEPVPAPIAVPITAPVEAVSKGGGVSLRVVASKSEFPHADRRKRAEKSAVSAERAERQKQSAERQKQIAESRVPSAESRTPSTESRLGSKPKDKAAAPAVPQKEEPKTQPGTERKTQSEKRKEQSAEGRSDRSPKGKAATPKAATPQKEESQAKSPDVRKELPAERKPPSPEPKPQRDEPKPQRDESKKDVAANAERKVRNAKGEERGDQVVRHSKSRASQGDAANIPLETSSRANAKPKNREQAPSRTAHATLSPTRAAIEPTDIPHDVEGKDKPSGFGNLKLSNVMFASLKAANYHEPSPVQAGLIPDVLAGHDVMGQARTGTGKTAAFCIPILEGLDNYEHGDEPVALILVPTRELAVQVRDEAAKLAKGRKVRIIACYGGKPIGDQIAKLKVGADIVVGTPGRILDLSRRGALKLDALIWVVLDEADRMLDIGFRPDIEKILRLTPSDRQTLLLSATLPPDVVKLAERYMREPKVIDFSDKQMAVETIDQYYITIDRDRKLQGLICLINEQQPEQAIVFCRTKRGADRVKRQLEGTFASLDSLHGDMTQGTRDRVMAQFRAGKLQILVATDVVGRGIDVTGISHIINYDIPVFCDDYVHRVGRTGRMGRDGTAFTFVTAEEGQELTRIEMRINQQLKRAELKDFEAVSQIVPTDKEPPKPVFGKSARRVRRAL